MQQGTFAWECLVTYEDIRLPLTSTKIRKSRPAVTKRVAWRPLVGCRCLRAGCNFSVHPACQGRSARITSPSWSDVVANLCSLYGLSHTVGTRQSRPFGPRRARLTNEGSPGILFSHVAKTRATRPYKTRSEKHPNLPLHCENGNSVALPLILGEARATLPVGRARSAIGCNSARARKSRSGRSANPDISRFGDALSAIELCVG